MLMTTYWSRRSPARRGLFPSGGSMLRRRVSSRQHQLMTQDRCLLVDEHDTLLGDATKKDCHYRNNLQAAFPLHRAFSVFLFCPDTKRTLLQRRSLNKLTFPGIWSNACCSHPVVGEDLVETMQRKLSEELGIKRGIIARDDFRFVGTMQYNAVSPDDPHWGEHELDHLFIVDKTVDITPNPEEVSETRWMDEVEVASALREAPEIYSPWFRAIVKDLFLPPTNLWSRLATGDSSIRPVQMKYPQTLA